MGATAQVVPLEQEQQLQSWSLASRIAFRFCFVYFSLYFVFTQVITSLAPIPKVDIPDLSSFWPIRQITMWVAAHIFRITQPLIYSETGSGDRRFDWILLFWLLLVSAVATAIWSTFDRRRENYVSLHKWFCLVIRFGLVGQMLTYGMDKFVPLQMPFPYLTRLLEPFRNFSPMGVLWASIGASPAYEIFAGSAEMLAGILLIFPRTMLLGALICMADMVQVFVLNMTYDVPVKLLSFHLFLMALFLAAPELRRLSDFFFTQRTIAPSTQPQLFQTRRANQIALAAQIVFGIWLLGMNAWNARASWHEYGGGRTKPALYGIWNIDKLSIDGQVRSPLITDYDRWRRAIFDFPERITFQRMDDSFAGYGAAIDVNSKTIALTKNSDEKWKGNLTFQRVAPDQLILDGTMDNHKIHMQLQQLDSSKFLLVSRGFHWVQDYPFNR
jgi:hypothetical protein